MVTRPMRIDNSTKMDRIAKIGSVGESLLINLDRHTWNAQYIKCIKAGFNPEKSIWKDDSSEQSDEDWIWVS